MKNKKTYAFYNKKLIYPFVDYEIFENSDLVWKVKEIFPFYFYPFIIFKILVLRSLFPLKIEIRENEEIIAVLFRYFYGFYKLKYRDPDTLLWKETIFTFFPFFTNKIKTEKGVYLIKGSYFVMRWSMAKFEVIFLDNKKNQGEVICQVFMKENLDGSVSVNFDLKDSGEKIIAIISILCLVLFREYR